MVILKCNADISINSEKVNYMQTFAAWGGKIKLRQNHRPFAPAVCVGQCARAAGPDDDVNLMAGARCRKSISAHAYRRRVGASTAWQGTGVRLRSLGIQGA